MTRFGYDDAGRLTAVTDAKGGITSYGYDPRGNRTSVTDANGHTTSFEYDLSNRLGREVVPNAIATTQFGYDPAGNRTSKLDGKNQTTGFVYDPNRRFTDINYASGSPAHFDYDPRGNKTLERNGDSERHMDYDLLGRLTHVQDVTVGHSGDYAGIANLNMYAVFDGTLIAPNASTTFGTGSGLIFTGSFYGKAFEVTPG